jgi:hypothetical protein
MTLPRHPVVGMTTVSKGQCFELLDWEDGLVSSNSGHVWRKVWVETTCPDCQRLTTFTMTWSQFRWGAGPRRRCDDCAAPGTPTHHATAATRRRADRARLKRLWPTVLEIADATGEPTRVVLRYLLRQPAGSPASNPENLT